MRFPPFPLFCFAAFNLLGSAAKAVPVTLYDGSAAPEAQGWTRLAQGRPAVVTVGLTTTEFNTEGVDDRTSPQNQYSRTTGESEFIFSINMLLISASYNQLDGGFMLSPAALAGGFSERTNSVTFAPGKLLWTDTTGPVFNVDTSVFHEYSIRYRGGDLDVFVDAPHADIVAGTAVPALSRPGVVFDAGRIPGIIQFGDFTNDANYNSHYIVDSITFDNFAVPEPTGALLMVGGLVGITLRRKRPC